MEQRRFTTNYNSDVLVRAIQQNTSIARVFVLFCFVLFCFVLFRFVSFRFVSFRFVSFRFVSFCFVLFCFVFVFVFVFVFSFHSRRGLSYSAVLLTEKK